MDTERVHPRVSVVVCTLGRSDSLRRTLASVAAQASAPFEVLVIDGDVQRSAEPVTMELAATSSAPIRYVAHEPGLTKQRNAGLACTNGDIVLFLDDDARATPGLLDQIVALFDADEIVGATGRVIEPSSHRFGHQTSRIRRMLFGARHEGTFTRSGYPRRITHVDERRDVEQMAGCFMSARTSVARHVRFDELLTGYALAEDEDFSYRLSRRGRIVYDPAMIVVHDNSGFGTRDRRAFSRQVVMNRAYLFRKNFPQSVRARVEFGCLLGLLLAHRLLNLDGAGARGVIDGIISLRSTRP
jgi:GT2 family glycosyltransferase